MIFIYFSVKGASDMNELSCLDERKSLVLPTGGVLKTGEDVV